MFFIELCIYFLALQLCFSTEYHKEVSASPASIYIKNDILNATENKNIYSVFARVVCNSRDFCKVNDTNVCAVRKIHDVMQYKDFLNSCYLFVSNLCENPGQEYYIISAGSCEEYFNGRRLMQGIKQNQTTKSISTATTKSVLRSKTTTPLSTLYSIETAFDSHICPHSCPNTYSPVCLNVNKGTGGEYFKFYTFVNHCSGDVYYCKHWQEFAPPPYEDEEEDVISSPLGWSFCGASRFTQFSRFSESLSSMGRYGWLHGDQRYSHIMEPHERSPGYG